MELKNESEIIKYWLPYNRPLVTIVCITYNHEKYISDAIDSFLMQETNFPFEVIIHDDASTDKTAEIIKKYERNYPGIIRPIYQTENQYSKKVSIWFDITFPLARGKYIALCEGDDYWSDPHKLQKQVDFMEVNEDCSLCFHAAEHVYEKNPEKNVIYRPKRIPKSCKFEMKHAILGGGGFMATNSMLFKRECVLEIPAWMDKAPTGDGPLMLLLASKGKMGYVDEVMSAYRVMTINSWSVKAQSSEEKRRKFYHLTFQKWNNFDEWTNFKYHSYVRREKLECLYLYEVGKWVNRLKSFIKKVIPGLEKKYIFQGMLI